MGILVHPLQGAGYADFGQGLHRAVPGGLPVHAVVKAQRFADLITHGVYGVEGGHGFLEDHGDPAAPDPAHGVAPRLEFVYVDGRPVFPFMVNDLSFHVPRFGNQPHEGEAHHALSAPAFTHHAKGSAATDPERDVPYGPDGTVVSGYHG